MQLPSFLKRFSKSVGPGIVTGIADDDPSGIATYAQTGALFGYSQLWLALFSFPFMVAIQEMCARIGMVTGKGLTQVIKQHYSKKVLYGAVIILTITNIVNIGADLGAMTEAVQLLLPIPFVPTLLLLTVFTVLVQVLVPYKTYVKFLKYLALTVFAYIFAAFAVHQNWYVILLSTLVPHISFTQEYLLNITAMLGTTISPYLFFWQAGEEVEEELVSGKLQEMGEGVPTLAKNDIAQMRSDTAFGMFISNLVTFFIIITATQTLGVAGIKEISSAAQVAEALRPFAGDGAFLLFALGIIGTGLLAVPVLAGSCAYALSEAFGWKEGLGKTFTQAKNFYLIIIIATTLGVLINFSSISPMVMLYYTAILNGVLAPPLMVIILLIANNKKILGKHTNSRLANVLGITITLLMGVLSVFFLIDFLA